MTSIIRTIATVLLFFALVAGLTAERPKLAASPQKTKRPNILFIAIDDLRPELWAATVQKSH